MIIASRPMTFEEYLNYDDGTDRQYELVDGQLIAMPTESRLNDLIASFLFACLLQWGGPLTD
jgi:Uma2 family endonuclease